MPDTHRDPVQALRSLLPYVTVLLVLTLLYVGWTFYARHRDAARIEENARTKEAEQDARIIRAYGDTVKILSFSGSTARVPPGGRGLICYSVANAKSVEIEPHIDDIKPSLSRCLEIHPRADTEYKLTATDANGHKVEQSFTVHVGK